MRLQFAPVHSVTHSTSTKIPSFRYADNSKQESRAIARKPRDAAAICFGLKFADIHCKHKSSQAPKATQQSSRHTYAKTEKNNHSRSFKVSYCWVAGKAMRDYILRYNIVGNLVDSNSSEDIATENTESRCLRPSHCRLTPSPQKSHEYPHKHLILSNKN